MLLEQSSDHHLPGCNAWPVLLRTNSLETFSINVLYSQGEVLECSLSGGDGLQQDQEAWYPTQDCIQIQVQKAAAYEGV